MVELKVGEQNAKLVELRELKWWCTVQNKIYKTRVWDTGSLREHFASLNLKTQSLTVHDWRIWKGRRQVRYLCRFDPCRDNATLVTEAVSNDGRALQYASENLRRATWHYGWLLDFLEFFFYNYSCPRPCHKCTDAVACNIQIHTICARTPERRTISSWWRHWSRIQRPHQSFNQPAPHILGWSRPFQAVSSYVYIYTWYTLYIYIDT